MLQLNILKIILAGFCIIALNANPGQCQLQGGTSQQIEQMQRQYQMGAHPAPPPTNAEVQADFERHRNGKPPKLTRTEQMRKEVNDILIEVHTTSNRYQQTDYYNSPKYLQDVPNYTNAIAVIREMLEGKRPLSVKDAYYHAEAAFGNLHLTYAEYTNLIKSNSDFILTWLTQKKYNVKDPEAIHYGIQKFMSDTLFITKQGKRTGHMPFFYDYIDVQGKTDTRNHFVTKTLATGTGQCHTFPVTYLILAEALEVNAYLAYCPRHSFIRYQNNEGTMIKLII